MPQDPTPKPIPTPFDAPLPGEPGAQPVQPQKQIATPFDAPLPGESGGPDDAPVQKPKSYLAYALGIDPTSPQTPANPQQPGEQFALQYPAQQGKLATAAGVGALGTLGVAGAPAAISAAIPPVLKLGQWAKANPIQAWAALQALKELVPGFKKATEMVKKAPGGE